MSWLKKVIKGIRTVVRNTTKVPENSWIKCESCGAVLYRAEFERNLMVCPTCNHHHRVKARKRLSQLLDPETGQEIANPYTSLGHQEYQGHCINSRTQPGIDPSNLFSLFPNGHGASGNNE